jgi:hypothetical protein
MCKDISSTKICLRDKAINIRLIVHLVGCFVEYLKMHGTTNPKFINAKQAGDIYTYKTNQWLQRQLGRGLLMMGTMVPETC